jgi:hypothetical protein
MWRRRLWKREQCWINNASGVVEVLKVSFAGSESYFDEPIPNTKGEKSGDEAAAT